RSRWYPTSLFLAASCLWLFVNPTARIRENLMVPSLRKNKSSDQPYIVFRTLEPLLCSRQDSSSHRLPGPRLPSPIARQRQISRLWTNINLFRKKNPFAPLGIGLFKLSLASFYWRARF